MSRSIERKELNPFKDDVIDQPRAVLYSVPGLNDAPLNELVAVFELLTTERLPRTPRKAAKAQLIISPDAGYGKSHLIGRLFQKLGPRATLIYLRPFQDVDRVWISILQTTIQELVRRDVAEKRSVSQLEAFSTGVLAHVAADSIASRNLDINEPVKKAVDYLRGHPLEIFAKGRTKNPLLDWLKAQLSNPDDLAKLANLFRNRKLMLHGKEQAWLKVLAAYAFSADGSAERDAALTWLRGEPLEPEQAESLKLVAREIDGYGDAHSGQISALSRDRIQGLCMLASYYRPFVFCFDQTEFYGDDTIRVNGLGSTIEQLFSEFPNQMTVVTSNAQNWVRDLVPKMNSPYHDRFSSPINLEGINQRQAADLISERLTEVEMEVGDIAGFASAQWLQSIFKAQTTIGVRRLLKEAAKQFQNLKNSRSPGAIEKGEAGEAGRSTIEEAFLAEVNQIRAKPSLHQYSQDCLMWFADTLALQVDGLRAVRVRRKYFCIDWVLSDRSIAFAFEAGHHNARWQAIASEATKLAAEMKRPVASVIFRTPDLQEVPRQTWNAARRIVEDAREHGLRIVKLSIEEVCELHGAREFYSNALQGNADFSPQEVLRFLRIQFGPWFKRMAELSDRGSSVPRKDSKTNVSAAPRPSPQVNNHQQTLTADQVNVIVTHMRERRLVDVKEVLERLGGHNLKEALLKEVENHPNLKAHPGPNTIVLQWRA